MEHGTPAIEHGKVSRLSRRVLHDPQCLNQEEQKQQRSVQLRTSEREAGHETVYLL